MKFSVLRDKNEELSKKNGVEIIFAISPYEEDSGEIEMCVVRFISTVRQL